MDDSVTSFGQSPEELCEQQSLFEMARYSNSDLPT
jgi:hypothetical protein